MSPMIYLLTDCWDSISFSGYCILFAMTHILPLKGQYHTAGKISSSGSATRRREREVRHHEVLCLSSLVSATTARSASECKVALMIGEIPVTVEALAEYNQRGSRECSCILPGKQDIKETWDEKTRNYICRTCGKSFNSRSKTCNGPLTNKTFKSKNVIKALRKKPIC